MTADKSKKKLPDTYRTAMEKAKLALDDVEAALDLALKKVGLPKVTGEELEEELLGKYNKNNRPR